MEMVEEEAQNQPNKRIKIVEEEEEDRISELPDCLIREILSRVEFTKDAIRTDTLCKRWRHLWTSISNLNYLYRYDVSDRQSDQLSNFKSFIDQTLTQRGQLKLNKFKLEIGYRVPLESLLSNSIRYAINCNVEDLDLVLFNMAANAEFVLPEFFFTSSCFTNIKLKGCLFKPTGAISWEKLVSLDISEVKLVEDLIANILSGCHVLETLKLTSCGGYKRLDITSKSVKNLVLDGYSNLEYEDEDAVEDAIIEVNAPYILSLTIEDELHLWKRLWLNVPSLVKARLNFENTDKTTSEEEEEEEVEEEVLYIEIIQSLSHVKELELCPEVYYRLEAKGFVFPSNLKNCDAIKPLFQDF